MDIGETLYVKNRAEWRTWLRKNSKIKKEIWLVYYKKQTGRERIPYDDAVEEALCYGWIDSTIKRIDDEKYVQKFTPRGKRSGWSELNIGRAQKMIEAGKMTKAGLALFENRTKKESPVSARNNELLDDIPEALRKALNKNNKARENFENFTLRYRRIYVAWVRAAKRPETIEKRIKEVVARSEKNIKPGML